MWGVWNQITARDGEAIRRVGILLRYFGRLGFLQSPDWEPFSLDVISMPLGVLLQLQSVSNPSSQLHSARSQNSPAPSAASDDPLYCSLGAPWYSRVLSQRVQRSFCSELSIFFTDQTDEDLQCLEFCSVLHLYSSPKLLCVSLTERWVVWRCVWLFVVLSV